ncbi:MAG: hypothetical protein K2Q34_00860 [Alphaproteobacteria bacterium]|nr:hypothetical protein [Alphaproteobacteria bacterium]
MMTQHKDVMIDAAWKLLEEKGLDGLTPEALSDVTLISVIKIRKLCPTPLSILLLLWSNIVSKAPAVNESGLNAHDILFESIMNHLDTLNPYKSAVHRFVNELSFAPCWLMDLKPYCTEWSRQRLSEAGIDVIGMMGSIKVQVFNLFCLYILKTWADDNTPDQSLTLAAIDQGLTKLEEWQSVIKEKLPF